jgi:hypothetical protein
MEVVMYEFKKIPTGWKVFWGMYEEKPQQPPKSRRVVETAEKIVRPQQPQSNSEWATIDLIMSA